MVLGENSLEMPICQNGFGKHSFKMFESNPNNCLLIILQVSLIFIDIVDKLTWQTKLTNWGQTELTN